MSEQRPIGSFANQVKRINEAHISRADVYSVTKYDGFVRSLDYFKKQVFSRDLSSYKIVKRGEFAYSTIHLDEGALGLLGDEEALISPMYTTFEVDESVDKIYLSYLLRSPELVSQYGLIGQGSVNRRKSVPFSSLAEIEVFTPPLPEQKKIAEILSGIDLAIGGVQRKIEKLRSARVALVESELRGDRQSNHTDTEIGVIPSHWKVKGILEVSSVASGQVDPTTKDYQDMILIAPNHIESGTGKVIGTETAIQQGAISGKYFAKKGSVILSKIRPNLAKVCMADHDCLTSADMYPITAGHDITPGYLKQVLLSKRFTQYATESSVRGNIPKINRDELSGYKFAMPPLNEQEAIVSTIESVEQTISMEESRVCLLLALKNSLSSDLLSGRKRVSI